MLVPLFWLVIFYSCININARRHMYVGDKCTIQKTGEIGECTIIHDCTSAKEGLKRKEKPQHCGFVGFDPVVCCADQKGDKLINRGRAVGELSFEKCMEYSKLVYPTKDSEECPFVNEDDAGYRTAQPKEFPHTALIGRETINGKSWECPAVLISENYILTTADCLYVGIDGLARFGGNLNATTKYERNIQLRNITELINFPEYLSRRANNNIALAKLSSPVEFNEFVHPACIHSDANFGTKFFSSDWEFYFDESEDGNNRYGSTRDMKKVTLETIPSENCTEGFKSIGTTSEEYICAALVSTSYQYQCSPRGPLLTLHPTAFCMQSVIGLEAFSIRSCNAVIQPTAYTNVYNYIDWIERNVWNEEAKL